LSARGASAPPAAAHGDACPRPRDGLEGASTVAINEHAAEACDRLRLESGGQRKVDAKPNGGGLPLADLRRCDHREKSDRVALRRSDHVRIRLLDPGL
jgi:hypothetical protein